MSQSVYVNNFKSEMNEFLEEEALDSIPHLLDEISQLKDEENTLVNEGKGNWRGTKEIRERLENLEMIMNKWLRGEEELIEKLKRDQGIEFYEELIDLIDKQNKRMTRLENDTKITERTYLLVVEDLTALRELQEEWSQYNLISQRIFQESQNIPLPNLQRYTTDELITAIHSTNVTPLVISQAKEWIERNETEINQQMEEQGFKSVDELISFVDRVSKDFTRLSEKGKQSSRGQKLQSQIDLSSQLQKRFEHLTLIQSVFCKDDSSTLTIPDLPNDPFVEVIPMSDNTSPGDSHVPHGTTENFDLSQNDPDAVLSKFPSNEVETQHFTLASTGQKVFLRGRGNLGLLSVTAVRCRFEDVGAVLGCTGIVNPANVRLQHVGGLAKFIADGAGWNFTLDSQSSVATLGQLRPGEARPLAGHNLSRFGIINVINLSVSPNTSRTPVPKTFRSELRLSVKNTLNVAEELKMTRLGIPGIGTGVFQWPPSVSADETLIAISEWVKVNEPIYLREIYLFDIDQTVVNEFFNALSTMNETNGEESLSAFPRVTDLQELNQDIRLP